MRRFYGMLLVGVLAAVALAGCGSKDQPSAAGPANAGGRIKIAVSIPAADHGWTAGVKWWAEQSKALYPDVDIQIVTAEDARKQQQDIQDLMVQKVDGLVILANESAPLTPIAKKAHEQGIYIVNVDRGFTEPGIANVYLEGDNKSFGRKSAEFVAQKLGGKGNLVILTGIPCTVDTDRVTAAREVFKKSPDINVLDQQPVKWSRVEAKKVMQDMLTKYPAIDAVWAQDDDSALGAIQAIKEAHRDDKIWVFGGAGMKDIVKQVMDHDPMVPGDVTYPPSMIAAGINLAVGALRTGHTDKVDQFLPKHMVLDVDLITPENAAKYYFPDSVY